MKKRNGKKGNPKDKRFQSNAKNLTQLAQILKVHPKTIYRWRAANQDFPSPYPDSSWNVKKVLEYVKKNGLKETQEDIESAQDPNSRKNIEILLLKEKVKAAQVNNQEKEKSLIPWSEVTTAMGEMWGAMKAIIDGMPRQVAIRVNPSSPGHAEKALKDWRDKDFYGVMQSKIKKLISENENDKK